MVVLSNLKFLVGTDVIIVFSGKNMINCMVLYAVSLTATLDYIKMFTDLRFSKMNINYSVSLKEIIWFKMFVY